MLLFYPGHASVLEPEMMVAWKREKGVYNFQSLGDTAVLCLDYAAVKHLNTFRAKKIKGIKGINFVRNGIFFCSGFDNGGPGILNLMEELRALGIQRFVFVGLAGKISASVSEAEAYSVERALSGSNATAYYAAGNESAPFDKAFFDKIANNFQPSVCFSTDAPFRETRPLLEEVSGMGAQLIEMECAAVYAFCTFYRLASACILIAADDLTQGWKAPRNWNAVQAKMKQVIDELIVILPQ